MKIKLLTKPLSVEDKKFLSILESGTEPKLQNNKTIALNQLMSLTNKLLENPTGKSDNVAFISLRMGVLNLFPKAKFSQHIMRTTLLIKYYFKVFAVSIQIISSKIKEHQYFPKLAKIIDQSVESISQVEYMYLGKHNTATF